MEKDKKNAESPKEEVSEEKAAEEKTAEEKTEEKKTPAEEINPKEEKQKEKKSSDKLEELRKEKDAEIAKIKDQLLRSLAEYDNFRKRSAKEKESAYLFSKTDVLTKLLPVFDNFERAAENEAASFEDYKKGISMIYHQFQEILKNLGVETFGEKGETFDPNLHSAVMHIEDENLGENVIAEVFGKGYRLGDKILRHATVQVAN